jgi:uncharacterized membrane protein
VTGPVSGTPAIPPQTPKHDPQDSEKNKDLAAFSYLYPMSVIVYLLKGKESEFIRYHSKQAMVLFAAGVIVWFVPVIGRVLELVVFIGVIAGFLAAAQGHWTDVPFAGPLSRGEMRSFRDSWKQVIDAVAHFMSMLRNNKPSPKGTTGVVSPPPPPASDNTSSASPFSEPPPTNPHA